MRSAPSSPAGTMSPRPSTTCSSAGRALASSTRPHLRAAPSITSPARLHALQNDVELLVIRPAATPAGSNNYQPFNLSTVLIDVHKDCYTALTLIRRGGSHRRKTLFQRCPTGSSSRPRRDQPSAAGIDCWCIGCSDRNDAAAHPIAASNRHHQAIGERVCHHCRTHRPADHPSRMPGRGTSASIPMTRISLRTRLRLTP